MGGTTSACAENTTALSEGEHRIGNYLRVRGEYQLAAGSSIRLEELPPRARRILGRLHAHVGVCGTTSACAENTLRGHLKGVTLVNYLRVRGEYHMSHRFNTWTLELPPRARRIPQLIGRWRGGKGTTSACAENTCTGSGRSCTPQNYLRVRGEYITGQSRLVNYPELPPRARRIQKHNSWGHDYFGTTSACAENTGPAHPRPR